MPWQGLDNYQHYELPIFFFLSNSLYFTSEPACNSNYFATDL